MMKKFLSVLICGLVVATLVGCSNQPVQPQSEVVENIENESSDSIVTDNVDDSASTDDMEISTSDETDPNMPAEIDMSANHKYVGMYNAIELIGLKEYDSLSSEYLEDKPAEGNKYLVAFLEVRNKSDDRLIYFNPDELTVYVDGQQIERTYLLNKPEGYTTIFGNVDPHEYIYGYFVCEVPADWQTFTYIYSGWQYIAEEGKVIVTDTVTHGELFEPKDILYY